MQCVNKSVSTAFRDTRIQITGPALTSEVILPY